jgi:hypothetical protein
MRAALATAVLLLPVSASAATITLQWDANTEPDVQGYVVRYGTASGVYSVEVDVGLTTTWSKAFTAPGSTTYFFVVQAYNSTSRSDNSAEVSTVVVNPVPTPALSIDRPGASTLLPTDFLIQGWAADLGAPAGTGTGMDAVHVYAYPAGSGAPTFLGMASYGEARGDVAAAMGAQFMNSGYSLPVVGMAPGAYTIAAYGHSLVSNSFSIVKTVPVTVTATPPVVGTLVALDAPTPNQVIMGALWVGGWAIDLRSTTGTGVDLVQVWAYPSPGSGTPATYLGAAPYGARRDDVGAGFGARYTMSAYNLTVIGLPSGTYDIVVLAHSTVTGGYDTARVVQVTIQQAVLVSIDGPAAGTTSSPFNVVGWALDRRATSNSGVDTVHVWAYPNPGSGTPAVFLGAATLGLSRPDVGAAFGSQFSTSGYRLTGATLSPGLYDIVTFAHSSVTGVFEARQVVRITVQ